MGKRREGKWPVSVSIRVAPWVLEYIKKTGENRSQVIRNIIETYSKQDLSSVARVKPRGEKKIQIVIFMDDEMLACIDRLAIEQERNRQYIIDQMIFLHMQEDSLREKTPKRKG